MKTFAPLFLIGCMLFCIFSCDDMTSTGPTQSIRCPDCPPPGKLLRPVVPEKVANDTISEKDAVELVSKWNEILLDHSGFITEQPIYAFTIPHQDLAGVFSSDSARAYLGMTKDSTYKLVFVGVDSTGKDELGKFYDFTSPCPPFCDTSSILYKPDFLPLPPPAQ